MNTVWESIYDHGMEEDGLSSIRFDVERIRNMIQDRFNPFLRYLFSRENDSQMIYEREVERMMNQILEGIMLDLEFDQFSQKLEIEKMNEERIFRILKEEGE